MLTSMKKTVAVVFALMMCFTFVAKTEAANVPGKIQTAFIFKIFNFDKAMSSKASGQVKVAVLYAAGNGESESVKSDVVGSLNAAAGKTIAGMGISVSEIAYSGADSLSGASDAAIIYVAPGLEGSVADIKSFCAQNKARSFTCSEAMVKSGIAVGVVLQAGKPKIMINKAALDETGANLGAAVLKLAQIV